MAGEIIRFVKKIIFSVRKVVADDVAKARKARLPEGHPLIRMQKHRNARHAGHSILGHSNFSYSRIQAMLAAKGLS